MPIAFKEWAVTVRALAEGEQLVTLRKGGVQEPGKSFELEATGLMAIAVQHENDHLNGVLMIDKLNALRRRLVSRKVSRQLQEETSQS